MLGLLLGTFCAVCRKIGDIKNSNKSNRNRNKAIRLGQDTYLDYYGAERLVKNGEYVFRHNVGYDIHKDYVLEDTHGNIIHNYSQNQRDKIVRINMDLAKKNGNTVYKKPLSNNELGDIHYIRKIYVDFETGKELFVQDFNQYSYFRDVQTGEYLRLTDSNRYRKGEDLEKAIQIMREQNTKWNRYSAEEKQRWLKREMRTMRGSDVTVPDSRNYNRYSYDNGKMKLTPEEYENIVNQY